VHFAPRVITGLAAAKQTKLVVGVPARGDHPVAEDVVSNKRVTENSAGAELVDSGFQ
jgi:hypothetical protein